MIVWPSSDELELRFVVLALAFGGWFFGRCGSDAERMGRVPTPFADSEVTPI